MGGSHVQPGYERRVLYKGQITLTFGCIVFASLLVPRFFCKIENKSFLNKLTKCKIKHFVKKIQLTKNLPEYIKIYSSN